jgi:asparagine synthase (glutamine-hydrolysing)
LFTLFKKKKALRLLKEALLGYDLYHPFITQFLSRRRNLRKIKRLLNNDFVNSNLNGYEDKWKPRDLADMLKMELTRSSVPRLLRYEDRNSSAFSLEARVPFLDHRLVEYVFSLPLDQRIRNGWTKHILRESMKGFLPEKIRKRRSKIGFAVPETDWMIKNKKLIKRVFESQKFRSRKYFNQKKVLEMFDEYCKNRKEEFTHAFWRLLNLEVWFEVFIDKKFGK